MNETLLNKARLNVVSLNKALINGAVERHGSSAGGGGEVIPPEEPDVPDVPVTYTLNASVENGSVKATVNGVAVTLPYTANEGDVVVVEVTANEGYVFEGWSDGSTDNPRSITMNADVALSAQCVEVVQPPVGNYIQFEDKAVEAICVANWSSDGIGLTEEDAAKVTDIANKFANNSSITSFNELEYFVGLTAIGGNYADWTYGFKGCTNLKSVVLPKSVTTLKHGAFNGCTSLESVGDMSHITTTQTRVFYNCSSLAIEVNMPNLNNLGGATFFGSGIKKVLSLGNTTALPFDYERGCFRGCTALTFVELSEKMTSIAVYSFYGCTALETFICRATTPPSLANANALASTNNCPIYVPDAALEVYKTATNWSQYQDRIHPLSELEGSPYIQFADAEVERVLMENNVSSDGVGITMADAEAVTTIGKWFNSNTIITSFNELQYFTGLTFLGATDSTSRDGAFYNCTSLQSVILPKSGLRLRRGAFSGCTSLTHVGNLDKVTRIDGYVFEYAQITGNISLAGLTHDTIGIGAFRNNDKITGIDSLGATTIIQDGSSAAHGAFAYCTSLQYVNGIEQLSYLGHSAFFGCTDLYFEYLNLSNLETLGQNAFYGVKIKKLNLGKITSLPYASSSHQNYGDKSVLEEVTIPNGVTTIPAYSFYNYKALVGVKCNATTPPTLENTNAFNNTNNCPIYVPDASVDAYKAASADWSTHASRIKPLSEYVES